MSTILGNIKIKSLTITKVGKSGHAVWIGLNPKGTNILDFFNTYGSLIKS